MKKNILFIIGLGLLMAGNAWAQQKAQIRIKKNINGVEYEENREIILDDNRQLEDVLKELNLQNQSEQGLIDQQIEISIQSTGDAGMMPGSTMQAWPFALNTPQSQRKPTLGVMLREYSSSSTEARSDKEVVITEVIPNTSAARAQLQAGDIILKVNDEKINSTQQVINQVKQLDAGGELKLLVKRNGKKKRITAVIEPTPKFESQNGQINLFLSPDSITMFDMSMGDSLKISQPFSLNQDGLRSGEAAYLGVTPSNKAATAGVPINVEDHSPAADMGLIDGDVILEFNGESVGDFAALANGVRKCKPGSTAELLIQRDGKDKRITGAIGKRNLSGSDDFQIFHDYKGMDDEGNYFYDFEFNMDAEDLQKQMEQFFRDLNQPLPEGMYPGAAAASGSMIRIEDTDIAKMQTLEIPVKRLMFDQLSFIPQPAVGLVDISFTTAQALPITVVLKDESAQVLLYDERALTNNSYERVIDLNAYPMGNYYLIIQQGDAAYSKKLVKYQEKK